MQFVRPRNYSAGICRLVENELDSRQGFDDGLRRVLALFGPLLSRHAQLPISAYMGGARRKFARQAICILGVDETLSQFLQSILREAHDVIVIFERVRAAVAMITIAKQEPLARIDPLRMLLGDFEVWHAREVCT